MPPDSSPAGRAAAEATSVQEIFELLFDLVERLREHFDRTVTSAGLAPIEGKALRHLDEPLNARELAARLKVDASYITSIVDSLEAQGLVDRMLDQADRRVKYLVLTPKGRQRTAELDAELFADVPGLSTLSVPKQRAFRDLLLEMVG